MRPYRVLMTFSEAPFGRGFEAVVFVVLAVLAGEEVVAYCGGAPPVLWPPPHAPSSVHAAAMASAIVSLIMA